MQEKNWLVLIIFNARDKYYLDFPKIFINLLTAYIGSGKVVNQMPPT